MQIRSRLTIQFVFVVTIIVLISFAVIYYSSHSYRKKEFYQRLENKANTSADIFISVDQIDSTMLRIFDRRQKDKLPFEKISIYNDRNREIYTNNDTLNALIDVDFLREVRKGKKYFTSGEREILGITFADSGQNFVIVAGAIDVYGKSKLQNLRSTLIILFFIIITILTVAGWVYAGRALKPLSQVIGEVEQMDVRELGIRLNRTGSKDEIGRLISTFNVLFERIENVFKLQKLFLSGASHELKNPLTTITSQLQVVLMKERSADEYKQIIHSILDDIKGLNKTTGDLIEFSRLNYENQIQLSGIRIDDILWQCKEFFRNNKSYIIEIRFENMPEDPEKLVIRGNEALLKVAFLNLVDNACKFSADHKCSICLFYGPEKITVSFTDQGIGLTEEEKGLIFEPFYRTDSTAESHGHGIGLALTKKIIELHHAEISVSSKVNVGSVFSVSFQFS